MPRISTILPVYNRAHCVPEALRSILSQPGAPDEVIVVDDGSTDDLQAALHPFLGQITVIRQTNAGVSAARNAGVRAATGEWITFLDSDDLWVPDRMRMLREDLQAIDAKTQVHLGNVMYETPTETRNLFDLKPAAARATHRGVLTDPLQFVISGMTTQGAAIHRDAFDRVGGFDEEMTYLEDTDLFCRLALCCGITVNSSVMAIVRRLPNDGGLTDVEVTLPAAAIEAQVRSLKGLEALPMPPGQRLILRQRLSGALFRLAYLKQGQSRRRLLEQAARLHPHPIKGRVKSWLARIYGNWGMQVLLQDQRRLNRSAGP
ncbi:glycosyltransferase family 2 protein [Actibacterium pelagium]|uniref:Glycosyltransferase 2-like domain-containing protein n=1 Tax=Actibacterium pelagium TaxID=2029103 RepID=A0A917ELB5_9RHOB|nr:glycosyltransferase family 2 protein [Actibacterium pelagium]GGE56989.1 hypothetical protein GCM10011517_25940 [Actibacterium pelagium]